MTASRFADELDEAAGNIAHVPRHEIAVLLRRAAIRIRSKPGVVLADEEEAALEQFREHFEFTRQEALRALVVDALIGAGYLEVVELDEGGETEGSAQ